MPGGRLKLALLPSFPTAEAKKPAHAFGSRVGKRTTNLPRAPAVTRFVARAPA